MFVDSARIKFPPLWHITWLKSSKLLNGLFFGTRNWEQMSTLSKIFKEVSLQQTGISKYLFSFHEESIPLISVVSLILQLKILRQLVDLQLAYSPEIKAFIDRAWGVQHNKHKKNQVALPPLDPEDPKSREKLVLLPIGQDSQRKRYWVADGPCTFTILLSFLHTSLFIHICTWNRLKFFFSKVLDTALHP